MSDSKGISLRKAKRSKKPTISAPKIISNPITSAGGLPRNTSGSSPFEAPPPQRPQIQSGKTSDLVKRRYSTRFNNLPADYDATAPPIPSIPSVPAQYAPSNDRRRGSSPAKGARIPIDPIILADAQLQADQYVTTLLTEAAEEDIDAFHADLQKEKKMTSTALQRNIYESRAQFVKISKEAEKLKVEMRALRNLMSELKTNTTSLRVNASQSPGNGFQNGPSTLSKKDRRTSVADRSILRNVGLQEIWKKVEGAQQLVPLIPGRFVICDAGFWSELDNATWVQKRTVRIFLFSDRLLIAHVRKRRADVQDNPTSQSQPFKLKAEKAWPLLDIEVVDLAGSSDLSSASASVADAIIIRGVGQESLTLKPESSRAGNKATFLTEFKKAVEELRRGLRTEQESSNKVKETVNYLASRDPGLLKKTELLETLSKSTEIRIEVDGNQENLRWVEQWVDRLDINIALQEFAEAVKGIEKLNAVAKANAGNSIAHNLITFKAEARAAKLAELISRELIDTHNNLKKTQASINLLRLLGFEDQARERYLEARTATIHRRSRQCVFGGNLSEYIWEVSFVYFTIIKNTVAIYGECFAPPLMSACVKWAKEQLDAFNVILLRQLSSIQRDSPEWIDCMRQAKEHASMLSEVGLDFNAFIGREASAGKPETGPRGLGLE